MATISSRLKAFFQRFEHRPIVVAYSGGIDSQVLLHALAQLKKQQQISNHLTVCHINHGLSDNAHLWQLSAQEYCHKLSIPLQVFQVNVKEVTGESLEALARDARYKALKNHADDNALIVTGHHLDDQSETFLLALKRGAGLKGLSAMAQVLTLSSENHKKQQLLLRPLLNTTRSEIEQYAQLHQLTWLEDESNNDLRFDRNFIRHQVIPVLVERWPSILTTIKRSSEHCQEGQQLLTELAQQDLVKCQITTLSLSVSELCLLSQARFNNVIRYFLELNRCLMPSTQQLQQVYQQLFAANDKNPAIKIDGFFFRRFKNSLVLTAEYQDISTWQYLIQRPLLKEKDKQVVNLPDGLGDLFLSVSSEPRAEQSLLMDSDISYPYIRPPLASQKVSIRFAHQNPRCLPDYRKHSRELKKVLQELNISPWQRKRIPFLYYDEILVAAIGHFVCKEFMSNEGILSIILSWKKEALAINN